MVLVVTRCAWKGCDKDFDPRARNSRGPIAKFCSRQCKDAHRNAGNRKCRACRKLLGSSNGFNRFCSNACKWSYLQKRRRAQSVSDPQVSPRDPVEPVAVLLPLGCEPRKHEQEHDPEALPSLRLLTCERYERCLTYAASKNWEGFTCRLCPTWRREK